MLYLYSYKALTDSHSRMSILFQLNLGCFGKSSGYARKRSHSFFLKTVSHISMTAELPFTPVISHVKIKRHSRGKQTHLCGASRQLPDSPQNSWWTSSPVSSSAVPASLATGPTSSCSPSPNGCRNSVYCVYIYPFLNSPPLLHTQACSEDLSYLPFFLLTLNK